MKNYLIFALAVFMSGLSLRAEVFTLAPSSGEGNSRPSEFMNPRDLWTEPVIVNGVSLEMKVSLLELDLKTCIEQLRKNFPDAKFAKNENSTLLEIKDKDGGRQRIYLVELGGKFPVLQFSMNLPEKIPDKFQWPAELPLPPGSESITAMEFPKRKSLYGQFSTSFPPEQALAEMKNRFEAGGWKSVSGESKGGLSGKGEVFIKDNPLMIAVVSFSESEGGKIRGSVYQKPIKP